MEGEASDLEDYVDLASGEVMKRPLFEVSVNGATISGVPSGTEVFVDGMSQGFCESGEIVIGKEDEDDVFKVRLELFPYLPEEVVI